MEFSPIENGPKSKPLPKILKNVLKPANDIRFIRQIKLSIFVSIKYSVRDLLFDVNNSALPVKYTVNN